NTVTGLSASTADSFTVEATDAHGTSSPSSSVDVTTLANSCAIKPSAPTGSAASGTTSSGTSLSWTTDTAPANRTISTYSVSRNGTWIGTPTGTLFAVSGLAASAVLLDLTLSRADNHFVRGRDRRYVPTLGSY